MTDYIYKSTTGSTIVVGGLVVTTEDDLHSPVQISVLDAQLGISIARYDDGVLALTDDVLDPKPLLKTVDEATLNSKFPPETQLGSSALVGLLPPYSFFDCNGSTWLPRMTAASIREEVSRQLAALASPSVYGSATAPIAPTNTVPPVLVPTPVTVAIIELLDVLANPVTLPIEGLTTYNVGPGQEYSDPSLVPFADFGPGSVVNIYYRDQEYNFKFGIRGQGTESNPIIINGVTDANGRRPKFNFTNAITCSGSNNGTTNVFSSTAAYGESLGGIVIKSGPLDGYRTYKPKWIQIKNLDLQGAKNGSSYTSLSGSVESYKAAAGIYLLPCSDILIDNCVIADNGFGVFSMAKNDHLGEACERVTVRNSRIYGNGVIGSYLEHNLYIQATNPIIEGNFIGQTRLGSLGSSYKSRSSGEIFRWNTVQASMRGCDWVHSEEQTPGIATQPDYGIDQVYGNIFENDYSLPGGGALSLLHYGGDNGGEEEGAGTTAFTTLDNYRKHLHFWNNTVIIKATIAQTYRASVFQASLSDTVIDAWNNIVYCEGNSNISWMRQGGILNLLGTNLVYGSISDAFDSAVPGRYSVNRLGTTITTNPLFMEGSYYLSTNSTAILAATSKPASVLKDLTSMPVVLQPLMGTNGVNVRTTASDLGALAYGVGYVPSPVVPPTDPVVPPTDPVVPPTDPVVPPTDPVVPGINTFTFDNVAGTTLTQVSSKWQGTNTDRFICDGTGGLGCTSGSGTYGESAWLVNGQGADQVAEVVVPPTMLGGGAIKVSIQVNGGQSGYYLEVGTTNWQVRREGVYQDMGAHSINIAAVGATISIGIALGTVTAKINNTTVWDTTDTAPITGGYPGFSIATDTGQEGVVKLSTFTG